MFGVSFDSVAANKKFADNQGFPYALLCDTTRAMGEAYGATAPGGSGGAARIGVIVDGAGVVRWAGRANAAAFPAEALETVRGLG